MDLRGMASDRDGGSALTFSSVSLLPLDPEAGPFGLALDLALGLALDLAPGSAVSLAVCAGAGSFAVDLSVSEVGSGCGVSPAFGVGPVGAPKEPQAETQSETAVSECAQQTFRVARNVQSGQEKETLTCHDVFVNAAGREHSCSQRLAAVGTAAGGKWHISNNGL